MCTAWSSSVYIYIHISICSFISFIHIYMYIQWNKECPYINHLMCFGQVSSTPAWKSRNGKVPPLSCRACADVVKKPLGKHKHMHQWMSDSLQTSYVSCGTLYANTLTMAHKGQPRKVLKNIGQSTHRFDFFMHVHHRTSQWNHIGKY